MNKLISLLTIGAIFGSISPLMAQQHKRISPHETVSKVIDGNRVMVVYGRPYTKDPESGQDRKIWGELVPYGQVWRAGANEATTFVTDTAVTVGGKTVPAGSYTLFTIPNQGKWTLIISKKTKNEKGGPLWGTDYPGEAQDLARTDMKVSSLPAAVENFTIALDKVGNGASLRMDWETTRASVEISEAR